MIPFSDTVLSTLFRLHDAVFSFIARNARFLKVTLLVVAHGSLIGVLFPDIRKEFGSLAANLLIAVLFLSPVATITGMPILRLAMGFRRELGVMMAYLATVHAAGYLLDPWYFDSLLRPYFGADILSMDPQLLFGLIGIVLTFPLLLTSNDLSLRALGGRNWKRLHSLVYPLFVVVAAHRFVAVTRGELEIAAGIAQTALLIGAYAVLKYSAWRTESLPFLRKPILAIGKRYGEFSSARAR